MSEQIQQSQPGWSAPNSQSVSPLRRSELTLVPEMDDEIEAKEPFRSSRCLSDFVPPDPRLINVRETKRRSAASATDPKPARSWRRKTHDSPTRSLGSDHGDERSSPRPSLDEVEDDHEYPGPFALALLTTGLCLSAFLVSLDRTIVATAIPRITDDFHSYDDVGWYGSAYLLTAGALQPLYGRIFTMFDIKWSFIGALGIFELGSLLCGIAPSSMVLIIGRAIAGWGSAGILTGAFVAVAHAVPLRRRPVFSAAAGTMFGAGAIVGPLLGGAFTELVTWRWCFYFNLPVGGATMLSMVFLFKPHKDVQRTKQSLLSKIRGLDLLGNLILIVAAVMLFLALQFQQLGWAWSSARITGLLTGMSVMVVIFCVWQWKMGRNALLPGHIILQQSVGAGCLAAFFIYGAILLHAYYLPIWFQAIKDANAVQSGVDLIPYMIANALFSVFAGIAVTKLGYFTPPAIIGSAIGAVGCGLLSTLQVDSGPGKWIGYQVLISAGLGMAVQQGVIAAQTVLPLNQVPIGIAAIVSMQSLGGAVFVSVGNNILQNTLNQASHANRLPGVDIDRVISAGATQFRSHVSASSLPALLVVYNSALQKVFIAAIPLAALAALAGMAMEWKSVIKQGVKPRLDVATAPGAGSISDPVTTSMDSTSLNDEETSSSTRSIRQNRRSNESARSDEEQGITSHGSPRGSFETARTSLQFRREGDEEAHLDSTDLHHQEKDDSSGFRYPEVGMSEKQGSRASIPGSWTEE